MKRYQLVLLPCEATSREYWDRTISSADKLADVLLAAPAGCFGSEQLWHVFDSRTGRVISSEEFDRIAHRSARS